MSVCSEMSPELMGITFEVLETKEYTHLELLNMATKAIASIGGYDVEMKNSWLNISNANAVLNVKQDFQEPFTEMLNTKKIYYTQTNNTIVVKDSIENLWFAKRFLRSLNASEDRFSFCVYTGEDEIYGEFTGNERIVLGGVGKLQLIDFGAVQEGKIKYKLKIKTDRETFEEYTIYSDKDTFSTQLNNAAIVKIRLY